MPPEPPSLRTRAANLPGAQARFVFQLEQQATPSPPPQLLFAELTLPFCMDMAGFDVSLLFFVWSGGRKTKKKLLSHPFMNRSQPMSSPPPQKNIVSRSHRPILRTYPLVLFWDTLPFCNGGPPHLDCWLLDIVLNPVFPFFFVLDIVLNPVFSFLFCSGGRPTSTAGYSRR